MDVEELEEADYNEGGDFETYDGEQPPKGTELVGLVKKMWWTYSGNDDPMLKVLFQADGNTGDEEEYEGLPIWENMVIGGESGKASKFRWQPFYDVFGLTVATVKNKTIVAEDDDNMGAPILKIGTWEPGSDEAYCRVITKRERFQGEWRTHVDKWLEYEESEPDEEADEPDEPDEAEEPEEETPAPAVRSRRQSSTTNDGRQSRSGRAAAAKPAARGARANARASAKEPAESKPAASARGGRRAATATASKPAARGKGSRTRADAGDTEEPPF